MKELVNKTELRAIVKEYEEIDIRHSATANELINALDSGYKPELMCPLIPIKENMEEYIQKNIRKMRTQLPDCTGMCTQHGCPDLVVTNCYIKLKPLLEKNK